MEICHLRRQWAVGQGSFHSASVSVKSGTGAAGRYDYVYDCGALHHRSMTAEMRDAVKMYRPRVDPVIDAFVLDALVISHFDRDHMNGGELIASGMNIDKIFVPYINEELLITEIARSASDSSEELLRDLFDLVHKKTLWGRPVVFVRSGPQGDSRPVVRRDPVAGAPADRPAAGGIDAVLSSTGAPPEGSMRDTDCLLLRHGGRDFWRIKFWNQSSSMERAADIRERLAKVGFPLAALKRPGGAVAVLKWLKHKSHRDDAVKAYRAAIVGSTPTNGVERANISNYISLAMSSGPDDGVELDYSSRFGGKDIWWARHWHSSGYIHAAIRPFAVTSWIGTGDALLGEPRTWQDFSAHFSAELPYTLSVLLPHHGAAPKSGARYYNALLNAGPGLVSVLSYGKRNTYGHPTTAVTDAVLLAGGLLRLVDENAAPFFLEALKTRGWT